MTSRSEGAAAEAYNKRLLRTALRAAAKPLRYTVANNRLVSGRCI